MIDAVDPSGVWSPFGAFSMAVIQGEVNRSFEGPSFSRPERRCSGADDMRAQVRKVLENVRDVLGAMGGRISDIVSLVHYAVDIEQFMATAIFARSFSRLHFLSPPTVEVRRLYRPDLMIEITAVAEIPRERFGVRQT